MSEKHQWNEEDDLIALYLYRFGTEHLPYSKQEIAKMRDISIDSMNMRIENFRFLDTGSGLEHFALQSEQIYKLHQSDSEVTLRHLAFPDL